MASIGSIGEQVDICLRAGDTLGPYSLALTDLANVPINLTGGTLAAAMSKAGEADIALTVTIISAVGGTAQMLLVATSALTPGSTYFSPESVYTWRLLFTDNAGYKQTLLYGKVFVAPGDLP